jgi:hypothetical protein
MEFDRIECFGTISVRIPRHWIESGDEEEDTCAFYDPSGDSGTLRVTSFKVSRNRPYTLKTLQEEDFENRDEDGVKFFVVGDEFVVAQWDNAGEKEPDVHMYWWTLSVVVTPQLTRQVLFSYAVSMALREKPGFDEHLEVVRDCVLSTHFKPETPN